MLRGENIVCFSKDWSEDPTSNNHVMRALARDNTILWLNSISTRAPKLTSSRDLGKIARKLRAFARGPQRVSPGLSVYTPLVLPFPHNPLAACMNKNIVRATVRALRMRAHMKRFQAWSFIPTAADHIGRLGEELSVYYCTDEWSQFSFVDKERIMAMERELCEKVDVVFTTSRSLLERKGVYNPHTYLASHGVDQAHFAAALAEETPVAEELQGISKPIVGFFGLIQDWIDVDLIAYLARQRPQYQVVLIGNALVDVSALERQPNVLMTGRRPYAELPRYCKGFSVALCPFQINELTLHVNPIKLREYLSAGLPVVATDLPECRLSPDWCRVAKDRDEFVALVDAAIQADSPEARRARSEAMKAETWDAKVEALGAHILRVKEAKAGGRLHASRA